MAEGPIGTAASIAAPASPPTASPPPAWTRPARQLEWLRPGLRAATDADTRRLRELPRAVAIGLPLAAVLIPVVFSIGTATTATGVQADPYDQFAFLIYDVFTESTPFMLLGLLIGLLSPAAGILFVLSYLFGNVTAAIVTDELHPPLGAFLGRLGAAVVLWLLVVEIPLLGRLAVEAFGARASAALSRRVVAVAGGALVVTGLTWAWVMFAPVSAAAVYWLTETWGAPFLRGVWTLLYSGHLVVIPAGLIALVVLALRYLGPNPATAVEVADESAGADGPPGLVPYVAGLALTGLLLLGVLDQPIDILILFGAVIGVPPVARRVLRATRAAPLLTRIAWPVRLVIGVALAYGVSLLLLEVISFSGVSRWFNTIIALAVSFFVIALLVEADGVVDRRDELESVVERPSVATVVTALTIALTILSYVLPVVVLGHDGAGDDDSDRAQRAAAAAGGAAGAAAAANRYWDNMKKGKGGSKAPPRPDFEKQHKPPEDKSWLERTSDSFKDFFNSARDFFNK